MTISIRLRTTFALTVAAALAFALAPAAAQAGQYFVDHCNGPGGTPGAAFGSIVSGANVSVGTSDTCGAGGALRTQFPTVTMNSGDYADYVLSIPADRPNLAIERIVTHYSAPSASGGGLVFVPIYVEAFHEIFNTNPPVPPEVDLPTPPGTRLIRWRVLCGGAPCTFSSDQILTLAGTRLYVNEAVAPTLAVTGGTLVSAGAKSGQPSIGFDANDADSGVAGVTVSLGSTVVGAVDYPCGLKDWSVCKRDQANQLLQVDTTKVPDGSHELIVTVRDAAANVLTRSLGLVAVANGPGVGAPNGANPSRLAKLTAIYATTKKRSRRLRYGATPAIRGTLVNERGEPITGATVAILQRPRQAGAATVQIATATTGPDGKFSRALPGGPSRTITFAYTAFTNDAKPASTSTLRTVVRALVSAQIAPRSVRAGQRVTISGKLALLPRAGVEIKIQPRQGRRWYTFGTVKTTRDGRFRWRYRFNRSKAGHTFAFRVRVDSPIYPFAAGNSQPVRVHVR